MKLFKKYIFLFYLNIVLSQLVPYEEPSLLQNTYKTSIPTRSLTSENIDQALIRFLTVRVKKHDLDKTYFEKKEI